MDMVDILLLDENPLDNILNTLTLKYTVQGGVVYDSATTERVDVTILPRPFETIVHQYQGASNSLTPQE